jgi:hypothetical protein
MKGCVDKSMGIITLIAEALAKIEPTELLRFVKRNWADANFFLKNPIKKKVKTNVKIRFHLTSPSQVCKFYSK